MLLSVHSGSVLHSSPDRVIAELERTARAGLSGYWSPMLAGMDTLTMLAVAAAAVPGIHIGTAVVPIPLRSPYALAQQVRTVQAITGGRLALGLGTSHPAMVREIFGAEWQPPLVAMREYLAALAPLLQDHSGPAAAVSADAPPILLGALNPAMARLASEQADGVVTWAAGRGTLEDVILPAAATRGTGTPFRIVVSLPFAVTSNAASTRATVQERYGANDEQPSYAKVREREGGRGIADLAVVGDELHVIQTMGEFAALGVTEFAAHIVASPDDVDRTWELLSGLASQASDWHEPTLLHTQKER